MPRFNVAAFILQGRSDYNALTGMNAELARALEAMKIEPVIVDLLDWQSSLNIINTTLREYTPRRILAAFSFSGIGMELGDDSPDGNVWQHIKVPALSWMLDHPGYLLKRHMLPTPAVMRLYGSKDFLHFQRDYVKAPLRSAHCRIGTISGGMEATKRDIKPSEKPLIIFPKSVANLKNIEALWLRLPVRLSRILNDGIDHYWGETARSGSVVPSVIKAAEAHGIEVINDLPLLSFLTAQIDHYIRNRKGNIVLQSLINTPVTLYGNGLKELVTDKSKATILPPIDFSEMTKVMHQALAVVTMNPNLDDDCHDRVYQSFGCGALPITDKNPWLTENYPDLVPFMYDFTNNTTGTVVEAILDDPHRAAETAWNIGRQERTKRPFQVAVAEAVELALMHRYFTLEFVSPLDIYVKSGD